MVFSGEFWRRLHSLYLTFRCFRLNPELEQGVFNPQSWPEWIRWSPWSGMGPENVSMCVGPVKIEGSSLLEEKWCCVFFSSIPSSNIWLAPARFKPGTLHLKMKLLMNIEAPAPPSWTHLVFLVGCWGFYIPLVLTALTKLTSLFNLKSWGFHPSIYS
jgi:hypothetical protein